MRSIKDLSNLSGRHALITGGAGHIGRVIAEGLAELGADVTLVDSDRNTLEKALKAFPRAYARRASSTVCDLSQESATRGMVKQAITKRRRLDILIHSAALGGATAKNGWAVPFKQQTVSAWDAALRVNLTSAFVMAQEAQPALTASGHGSIILFSSIYGVVGPDFKLYSGTSMANPAGYGASKGGLLQLMRYLATEMAPKVRVNTISPGGIWRGQPDAFIKRYQARTPLQRMGVEEDIKGAVAYLASDLSNYVTGHNLLVDGGWTAW